VQNACLQINGPLFLMCYGLIMPIAVTYDTPRHAPDLSPPVPFSQYIQLPFDSSHARFPFL
jgi:hypothetical protein